MDRVVLAISVIFIGIAVCILTFLAIQYLLSTFQKRTTPNPNDFTDSQEFAAAWLNSLDKQYSKGDLQKLTSEIITAYAKSDDFAMNIVADAVSLVAREKNFDVPCNCGTGLGKTSRYYHAINCAYRRFIESER
jgi:hypothetical protein